MCGQRALLLAALVLLVSRWTNALNGKKPNYRVEFERFKIHRDVSDEYFKYHFGRIGLTQGSVDRVMVLNVNYTLKKEAPPDAWLTCIAYEQKANRDYSQIPVTLFAGKFCDMVRHDPYVYKDFVKYTNFPDNCPAPKGLYFIHDYKVNERMLAPEGPGDRWRLDIEVKTSIRGETIFKWSIYLFLNRSI